MAKRKDNQNGAGRVPGRHAQKPGATGIAKGRPPLAKKPQAALSAEKTRQLIRTHHQLNKQLALAEKQGKADEAAELKRRIERSGGLQSYQQASILGQANERGGDSSVVLMEWLAPLNTTMRAAKSRLRLLEVGALSTKNACSRSGVFEIERIDLNSQDAGIKQQDFMARPLPASREEKFDIISLSLVLNFVPSAEGRGEMLRRTCQFLATGIENDDSGELHNTFPALFLVLPAPCISNSRYMTDEHLGRIMASLGYMMLRVKQTAKLVYYLWHLQDRHEVAHCHVPKYEVNAGRDRNNFSIVLKPEPRAVR